MSSRPARKDPESTPRGRMLTRIGARLKTTARLGLVTKRVHVALGVPDLHRSIEDYRRILGLSPELVIPGTYALFRTDELNLSLRVEDGTPRVRHLGFEDDEAGEFSVVTDSCGFEWERFTRQNQLDEIRQAWPDAAP